MKSFIKYLITILLCMICFMPSVNASNSIYEAYYELIQDKIDAVGYYDSSEYAASKSIGLERNGLIFARLVDFDLDGIDELVTFESKQSDVSYDSFDTNTGKFVKKYLYDWYYSVYSYKDGNLIELVSKKPSAASTHNKELGFCVDSKNRPYLIDVKEENDDEYIYGTVVNGVWTVTETNSVFIPDWSASATINGEYVYAHSNVGKRRYYIDNKEVTSKKFSNFEMEKRTKFYEMYNARGYNFKFGAPGDVVYSNKMPIPDNTPYQVLEQLAPFIPEYVARYRTPSSWALETVNAAIKDGFVDTSLQKKYTTPITRKEFCLLVCKFYEKIIGKEVQGTVSFQDTNSPEIGKMAYLGIINGVGDGKFNPDSHLTREMAAVILSRLAEKLNISLDEELPSFADNDLISDWASIHIGKIQKAGIMSGVGDGMFAPKGYYTREQSIITVERMKKSFVEVEKLKMQKQITITKGDAIDIIPVTIYPENATNRVISWSSSDRNIARVFGDEIVGVNEGTAILTATASNGVSATCKVVVDPLYANLKTKLGTELNVLNDGYTYLFRDLKAYEYIPDNPHVAAKIAVTDIEEFESYYDGVKITVELTEIIEGYEDEFDPYIKWHLKDEDNELADYGVEKLDLEEVGDETTIRVMFKRAEKGKKYYLGFVNDKGKEFVASKNEPKVKVKGIPLETMETKGFGNSAQEVTFIIDDVECVFEYDDDRSIYEFDFYIYGSIEGALAYKGFKWRLTDSDGEEIEYESYEEIPARSVEEDGSFESFKNEDIELQPGETYYLEFIAK